MRITLTKNFLFFLVFSSYHFAFCSSGICPVYQILLALSIPLPSSGLWAMKEVFRYMILIIDASSYRLNPGKKLCRDQVPYKQLRGLIGELVGDHRPQNVPLMHETLVRKGKFFKWNRPPFS